MATVIPDNPLEIYQEDVKFGVSVSEQTFTKMGATINHLLHNTAKLLPTVGSATQVSQGLANYTSIQDAIDDAIPGSRIYILAGTYNDPVVINKNISLCGEGRGTNINSTVDLVASLGDYSQIKDIRFGDNVTVNASYCSIAEIWLAPTKTINNLGVSNYIHGIAE